MPWELTYTAASHGGRFYDERERVHWQKIGGVVSTMGFEANDGRVSHPSSCAGMQVSLRLNSLGAYRDLECEAAGFIGDGWAEGDRFLFRVYVDYEIARGLIDQIYTYSRLGRGAGDRGEAFTLQFDLMNLNRLTVSGRPQLAYRTLGVVA